jgi:hypothetical protein
MLVINLLEYPFVYESCTTSKENSKLLRVQYIKIVVIKLVINLLEYPFVYESCTTSKENLLYVGVF